MNKISLMNISLTCRKPTPIISNNTISKLYLLMPPMQISSAMKNTWGPSWRRWNKDYEEGQHYINLAMKIFFTRNFFFVTYLKQSHKY